MATHYPLVSPTPEGNIFEIYKETLEVTRFVEGRMSSLYQGHLAASKGLNEVLSGFARNAFNSVMALGDWQYEEVKANAGAHWLDSPSSGGSDPNVLIVDGLKMPYDVIAAEREYRDDELLNRLWATAFEGFKGAKSDQRKEQGRLFYNTALDSEKRLTERIDEFVAYNLGLIASLAAAPVHNEPKAAVKPIDRQGAAQLSFEPIFPSKVSRAEQILADNDLEWLLFKSINAKYANQQLQKIREQLSGKRLRFELQKPQQGSSGVYGYYDPNYSHGEGLAVYNYDIAPQIEGDFVSTDHKGVITISNPAAPVGFLSIICMDESSNTPTVQMSIIE